MIVMITTRSPGQAYDHESLDRRLRRLRPCGILIGDLESRPSRLAFPLGYITLTSRQLDLRPSLIP
jgi:hypothetical protein